MPTGVQPMTLSLWHRRALLVLLSVCTYTPQLVYGCGPGPGIGTRHRPRKLVPLRYKQYVPQISENNLGASGRPEGKITRDSERFNELVCNYNIHIVFKDEEHTQADRFMTKRLKDCLDRLAIAVMLQWPKTLLRVTEAWDEDGNHPPDSLHYEGRAVDITTSDRNNSKYGLLAQLAVEAGFDWVHYESKHHVHCSVKADHSLALERGGCFPGSGQVTVEGGGQIPMSSLKPGNKVLARTKSGKVVFSEVLLFLHKDIGRRSVFLVIQTEDGQRLALTPNHLIFHSPLLQHERDPSNYQAHFASRLERGDYILVHSTGDTVRPCKVISVTQEEKSGMYAPLTAEGTLFVDGMLVSSYASVENHELAHWAFAPLRFLLSFPLWTQEARHEAGQASVAADPPYRQNIDHSRHHMYQKGQNCTLELKCQGWNQNLPQTPLVKKYFGQTTEEDSNQGHIHWYAKILQLLGQILLDPLMFY